jgi:hypothetical protein
LMTLRTATSRENATAPGAVDLVNEKALALAAMVRTRA